MDPQIPRLLIVDGLNEIEARLAQELIFSLDEYAATAINTSVVVADRFLRRDFLNTERWSLCTVQPLSSEEILVRVADVTGNSSSLTEDQREILSTPYFLDAYLKNGTLASTRSGELEQWFSIHALRPEQLATAAQAAYDVYGSGSRTFSLQAFESVAGQTISEQLQAAGALLVFGEEALFDHHLKHDFLASRHLVSEPALWNRESFNHVTFDASSFDAIMMCAEQVGGAAADQFIRRVYDWNIYGVGYALAESRQHNVSKEMCWVIWAMFAEKMWDVVHATAQRARDTLLLLENEGAEDFLRSESLSDVLSLVSKLESDKTWFADWKKLFAISNVGVSDETVHLIAEEDSVLGWTMANVLKRSLVADHQQQYLRELMVSGVPVVKWRAAHSLGAFPSKINALALLSAIKEQDRSLRYGASRSVLEMAAKANTSVRNTIFRFLEKHHTLLSEYRSVIEEIRRTMLIPAAHSPEEWLSKCIGVIVSWQPLEPAGERDKWARVAQTLIATFAAKNSQEAACSN